jgi:hypothetical protein
MISSGTLRFTSSKYLSTAVERWMVPVAVEGPKGREATVRTRYDTLSKGGDNMMMYAPQCEKREAEITVLYDVSPQKDSV